MFDDVQESLVFNMNKQNKVKINQHERDIVIFSTLPPGPTALLHRNVEIIRFRRNTGLLFA